jgi:hypothetical protein
MWTGLQHTNGDAMRASVEQDNGYMHRMIEQIYCLLCASGEPVCTQLAAHVIQLYHSLALSSNIRMAIVQNRAFTTLGAHFEYAGPFAPLLQRDAATKRQPVNAIVLDSVAPTSLSREESSHEKCVDAWSYIQRRYFTLKFDNVLWEMDIDVQQCELAPYRDYIHKCVVDAGYRVSVKKSAYCLTVDNTQRFIQHKIVVRKPLGL